MNQKNQYRGYYRMELPTNLEVNFEAIDDAHARTCMAQTREFLIDKLRENFNDQQLLNFFLDNVCFTTVSVTKVND